MIDRIVRILFVLLGVAWARWPSCSSAHDDPMQPVERLSTISPRLLLRSSYQGTSSSAPYVARL